MFYRLILFLKLIYSEKATQIFETSTLLLSYVGGDFAIFCGVLRIYIIVDVIKKGRHYTVAIALILVLFWVVVVKVTQIINL